MSFMSLPVEVVLKIFDHLHAKDLISCSGVCSFWYEIVKELRENELFWWKQCKKDYKDLYKTARIKSKKLLTWFELYKSLTLWAKVHLANHTIIEFAIATTVREGIRDFYLVEDNTVGVFNCDCITYYDTCSLKINKPKTAGFYMGYAENEHVIAVVSSDRIMYISKKNQYKQSEPTFMTCYNVKLFIIHENKVYYVKSDNAVYVCVMSGMVLKETHLFTPEDSIIHLSYVNDQLYGLTSKHTVIYYDPQLEKTITEPTSLNSDLNVLCAYGFTKNLNWNAYDQWLYCIDSSLPKSISPEASTVLVYGNIVAMGTITGVFSLHYFIEANDMKNLKLIRKWDFRGDGDNMSPIQRIDVKEILNGHRIFIATSKKMIVIELLHN